MIVTLKEYELNNLIKYIHQRDFLTDGCSCGDFVYKLDENLYLTAYRSCRKSSMTPDHKLWQIHDFVFFDKVNEIWETYTDGSGKYLECYEFHNELNNVKLNDEQVKIIMDELRKMTKGYWRSEYRD